MVFQDNQLFPHRDVIDNVAFGLKMAGIAAPERRARAEAWLRRVGLEGFGSRTVTELSGGEAKRVALARTLVVEPAVVLLDEPLTGLDPRQRSVMVELFHELGAAGRCVLESSHVLEEVARMGSRILVIAKGRLAAEGDFHAIRELMDDRPHEVRIRSDRARELAVRLLEDAIVRSVDLDGDALVVETDDAPALRRAIAPLAMAAGARIDEFVPLNDDLESVFRYQVGAR